MGNTVDNTTRFMLSKDFMKSFSVPISGLNSTSNRERAVELTVKFMSRIKGLDEVSLFGATMLSMFETCARNPVAAMKANVNPEDIQPDEGTRENLWIMIERSVKFFTDCGPVTEYGFTFAPEGSKTLTVEKLKSWYKEHNTYGGYTHEVVTGDGDYLTADGLWDMKVSKGKLTSKQTLQILMYWIMGQHSGKEEFRGIEKIGVFNPRLNIAYVKEINDIDPAVIEAVERDVIKY